MTPQEAIEYLQNPLNKPMDEPIEATLKRHEEAVNMAIEALGKQIPEPMMKELDISGRPIRVCGNCGDAPGNGEFCHWCGQRIER